MDKVRRTVVITCLHGFLGNPRDWDFLRHAGFAIETPPLDAIPNHGDVLLGYSLGGRLALQALLAGANYKRAILVSTGLGIEDEDARAARRASDEAWSQRFESEDFDSVIADWNAQPVLSGLAPERTRSDYDARALREWSSGALPPVASHLHELTLPTFWIAGARDTKYIAEAHRAASLARKARVVIIDKAGHRVPWERPAEFVEAIRGFTDACRTDLK
jgi:2-succinyl-6-hydroxy-2,4-cyclohexadiene-1-carboxylate synthase